MKVTFSVLILFSSLTPHALLAQNDSIFLRDTPLIYLGIDFSKLRYFGDPGTVSALEMKEQSRAINFLVVRESNKYDIGASFFKNNIVNELTFSDRKNMESDMDLIMTNDLSQMKRLNSDSIQAMIGRYGFDNTVHGIGLLLIAEGINKELEQMYVWVTFVDLNTQTVLLAERLSGKGFGFGFRNHWAGSINDILKKAKSGLYSEWKKKYSAKN